MNTNTELMTSADLGDCELCKKEFDSGDYCKTIHNHCLGDDIVCCRCWCAANPKFHCPDAWRYLEEEEEEESSDDESDEEWQKDLCGCGCLTTKSSCKKSKTFDKESILSILKEHNQYDGEEIEIMTYDRYVNIWSSTWGGGKGSEEANVWWDILGHTEGGSTHHIIYDNTLLDLYDEKKCVECLKDKTKICIVEYLDL